MSIFKHKDLVVPIHVTRKDSDGIIGSWSVGGYVGIFIFLLLQANVVLWSAIGIYEAVTRII